MSIVVTILITILIFGVIIFIHELGHFIAARISGVTVNEFSLGMGPAIFKIHGKKTLYALRLLPIGGFCAMEGENGEEEKEKADAGLEKDPGAFCNKNVPIRIFICAAGAFMNLLLGFAIILSTFIGVPYYNSTTVAVFKENASSSQTGLQEGDKIVKMNHTTIVSDRDIVFEALRDDDGIIPMEVIRNGERVILPEVTFTVSGEGESRSIYLDFKVEAIPASFINAFSQAAKDTFSLARNSWTSVGDLFTGKVGFSDLSGPVGVGQVVGEAAKIGFSSVISLAAFISISIGMFNLLPFPALDGGRILFLVIEAIRRKPINPKWEGYINAAGLLILLGLMVVITGKDILNLFK